MKVYVILAVSDQTGTVAVEQVWRSRPKAEKYVRVLEIAYPATRFTIIERELKG